jgi:hypothetical protein
MAHEEAAFSRKHSAVSENQHQHQHQRPFTAEPLHGADAEDAEVEKGLSRNHGKPDDEQERVQQRAQALAIKLAQTYEELTRLLERNPGMKRQITEGDSKEDKVYQKLKQRLKMADMAPRCQWVRQDGTSCRSPQMKQHIYCFAHMQMAEARTLMLMLPAAEDANAIQVGLMQIQKALIEDRISMKKAGLLLYSMQLAMTNVGQTTFGKAKDEEMVRETVSEEEALNENQHLPRRHGDTEEEKDLPRMHADERGLENPTPIFWKLTPDMYRMDTKEGREAYEASLRSSSQRRPAQSVVPPQPAKTARSGDPGSAGGPALCKGRTGPVR